MEPELILDRYRLLEERARGGFSTVEVAWDTRMQRRVAIKRIPLEDDATSRRSTARTSWFDAGRSTIPGLEEARTAALLSNPSIVEVYDFEYDDEAAYIIMKLIDGPTLAELEREEGGMLGLDVVAAVVAGVSEALEFAHENQVLHLDVKPDNILIDRSGRILVTDFGISQIATAAGYDVSKGGTIGYMPPEQLRAEEPDERTDEWAFAAVVYEMLCGANPFREKTFKASLKVIEDGQVPPPSSFRADIDPGIDAVVMRALSPERDERLPYVSAFTDELLMRLPAPKGGRRELRHLLDATEEQGTTELAPYAGRDRGLWRRLSDRTRTNIGRVAMLVAGTWLSWQSSTAAVMPAPAVAALTTAVAVSSAAAPRLGAILALLCFASTLAWRGAYVLAGALAACALLWWVVAGRRGTADAVLPLVAPLACFSFLGSAFPLLCGFRLETRRAVAATLFGGVLMLFVGTCTGAESLVSCNVRFLSHASLNAPFVAFCTRPSTLILLAAWIVAGTVMSPLCSKTSRMLSIVGSAIGCLVALGAQMAIQYLDVTATWELPPAETCAPIAFAFVVMCAIAILGAPYRPEQQYEGA
ncbi:MAG: serine/threonine-protein kinase [Coriobacteriales bacterium]